MDPADPRGTPPSASAPAGPRVWLRLESKQTEPGMLTLELVASADRRGAGLWAESLYQLLVGGSRVRLSIAIDREPP